MSSSFFCEYKSACADTSIAVTAIWWFLCFVLSAEVNAQDDSSLYLCHKAFNPAWLTLRTFKAFCLFTSFCPAVLDVFICLRQTALAWFICILIFLLNWSLWSFKPAIYLDIAFAWSTLNCLLAASRLEFDCAICESNSE